ncbi:MAG: alpha/beta fold hydrolase [Deltaproteobacteria bacterium]|nr:alpha/beta fold hydrolase [Deltaproteobacteria bacterium]
MATDWQQKQLNTNGITINWRQAGAGAPLVVLHGEEVGRLQLPLHQELAQQFQVIVPSVPGVSGSELPDWVDSVDDLAYLFLDLLEHLNLGKIHLMGHGFGGWVAAEMAVRSQSYIEKLVLVDSLGIKISEPWVRDITDTFVLSYDEWVRLAFYDPAAADRLRIPGSKDMGQEELLEAIKNRQTVLMLGWRPFMHNPKLKRRLARIHVPTLVAWGEHDRVVTPDYGRALQGAISGAKFSLIPRAGHYPHVEQPQELAVTVKNFLL